MNRHLPGTVQPGNDHLWMHFKSNRQSSLHPRSGPSEKNGGFVSDSKTSTKRRSVRCPTQLYTLYPLSHASMITLYLNFMKD